MADGTTTVPAFRVTSGFWKDLPQMPVAEFPGTEGYIDDVYPNPEGSPMAAGYFKLDPTDAPHAIFFPKGSRIRFVTPAGALAFYVGQRTFAP